MTRSNRVRSIAVLAAGALLTVPLLTACGAGQVANTADMVASVPGANATATIQSNDPLYDNTTIAVRNVTVVYTKLDGYPAGGTAPLAAYFVNNTPAPMTLTGAVATYSIPGDDTAAPGTATVVLTGGSAPATPSAVPSSPAPNSSAPSSSPRPSGSGSAGASGSPSGSASASGSASPAVSTPPAVGRSTFTVDIPQAPAELVALAPANGEYLQLTKLSVPLLPGAVVHLVFTFKLGNGAIQTIGEDPAQPVDAPFGPPATPAPRAPLTLSPTQD